MTGSDGEIDEAKVGMVNFTYRNSPALQKGQQMVLAGEIGAVRHVEA